MTTTTTLLSHLSATGDAAKTQKRKAEEIEIIEISDDEAPTEKAPLKKARLLKKTKPKPSTLTAWENGLMNQDGFCFNAEANDAARVAGSKHLPRVAARATKRAKRQAAIDRSLTTALVIDVEEEPKATKAPKATTATTAPLSLATDHPVEPAGETGTLPAWVDLHAISLWTGLGWTPVYDHIEQKINWLPPPQQGADASVDSAQEGGGPDSPSFDVQAAVAVMATQQLQQGATAQVPVSGEDLFDSTMADLLAGASDQSPAEQAAKEQEEAQAARVAQEEEEAQAARVAKAQEDARVAQEEEEAQAARVAKAQEDARVAKAQEEARVAQEEEARVAKAAQEEEEADAVTADVEMAMAVAEPDDTDAQEEEEAPTPPAKKAKKAKEAKEARASSPATRAPSTRTSAPSAKAKARLSAIRH